MSWKYCEFRKSQIGPESSFDSIVVAIQKNDVKTVKLLLKTKSIKLADLENLTVLHTAARWGNEETLRVLLKDPRVIKLLNSEMYNGDNPILAASKYGNVTAVRLMTDYGAELNCREHHSGNTPLHFAAMAADCDLMNSLLSRGPAPALVNAVNKQGDPALHIALKRHSPSVPLLLQAGADFTQPNQVTGRNVLHVSVVYNQCGIVQELLMTSTALRRLANVVDKRGDTALMLAVRMACVTCVKALVSCMTPGSETNRRTGRSSILHMAVETDNEKILKYLLMFSNEKTINQRDAGGRTPLLLAIERQKNRCLEALFKTQNIYVKNALSLDTALHTAIRVNNRLALSIVMHNKNAAAWSFAQKNAEGTTPFWLAVECGHAPFVVESRRGGWVDIDELNELGDSAMFVAAACGHLKVLKALLLSHRYYAFSNQHSTDTDLIRTDQKLIRSAEVCCDIYNTDIFILTGSTRRHTHSWIPKWFFSVNTKTGQNIFHACSIGGNVDCLEFIYHYCTIFLNVTVFDEPDEEGNTPLLLATRNDLGRQCVYFYLTKGATISSINNSGESVLESLLNNNESAVPLLIRVLNEGILYDTTARGLQEQSECLQVNYSQLRPPNHLVTGVVKLFYETIEGPQRTELLQHTLFKTYIHLTRVTVNYVFLIRLVVACASTTLLTAYLIFFAGKESDSKGEFEIIMGFRYSLGVLSILGVFFSIPLMFHDKLYRVAVLTYCLMLLPCLMTLVFVLLPHGSQLSFEVASLTVLATWLSLVMYSTMIIKDVSQKMAMLCQVIYGMLVYFRIVILILIPFSLAFFCIFNDNVYFVSPIKAFIYTCAILLQGDTHDSFEYFEKKHSIGIAKISSTASTTYLDFFTDQFDLILESSFLLIFIITCVLGLMNMLVGLAVRDGKTLKDGGEVFRRRLQIHWLNSLELFLQSRLYRFIRHTPLIYLFGIIPSWTILDPQVMYTPMVDRNSFIFSTASVIELKKSVAFCTHNGKPVNLLKSSYLQ